MEWTERIYLLWNDLWKDPSKRKNERKKIIGKRERVLIQRTHQSCALTPHKLLIQHSLLSFVSIKYSNLSGLSEGDITPVFCNAYEVTIHISCIRYRYTVPWRYLVLYNWIFHLCSSYIDHWRYSELCDDPFGLVQLHISLYRHC